MRYTHLKAALFACASAVLAVMIMTAQEPSQGPDSAPALKAKKQRAKRPPRPGVSTPGVRREMSAITPIAVFPIEGTPDWQVVTEDAVWVSNGPRNTIHRLDPKTNMVVASVPVGERPCSGLAAGFNSIWVPTCKGQAVSRVDTVTNTVTATIHVAPAQSEGGIAASPDAVWMTTDLENGTLVRIDPNTNLVTAEIDVAAGSTGVTYGEGAIWVTSPKENVLTKVDPKKNKVEAVIPVGPTPRFVTTGAGSVWTLNQGDGTVTRVEAKNGKVLATIEAGVPGGGGEIAFGGGYLWFTVFEIPITQVDPMTNQVVKQWFGDGGDAIRIGHDSIWLSNLRQQNVWRIDLQQP